MSIRPFSAIENYIYLFHTNTFILIPVYPESIADSMQSRFSETSPLSRSAPIFTYSGSGPRSVQINLELHRDMMEMVNQGVSNMPVEIGDDYVDTIIKQLQAMALPRYSAESKMVNPPMVAVKFGNTLFIKGIVNGGVTVNHKGPILSDDRYAMADISFTVYEVDPYSADSILESGSNRGLTSSVEKTIFGGVR